MVLDVGLFYTAECRLLYEDIMTVNTDRHALVLWSSSFANTLNV
jgi:hypothetical protein